MSLPFRRFFLVLVVLMLPSPSAARPAGAHDAVEGGPTGKWSIFAVSTSGGRPVDLSRAPFGDAGFAVSPDGRSIAFTRSTDDLRNEVWVMQADGTAQRRLVSGGAPVWSPDSRTIAYESSNAAHCVPPVYHCGDTAQIVAVRRDGRVLGRLANRARMPTWTRLGSRLAYVGDLTPYGEGSSVYIARRDGRGAVAIDRGSVAEPSWSAAGTLLAYWKMRSGGSDSVVVTGIAPRRAFRIARARGPRWSPARPEIAFVRRELDARGEFVRNSLRVLDTRTRRQRLVAPAIQLSANPLYAFSRTDEFAWSPRGVRLVYIAPGGIYVANRDGRTRRRIVARSDFSGIDAVSFAPDGRRIVFAARREP